MGTKGHAASQNELKEFWHLRLPFGWQSGFRQLLCDEAHPPSTAGLYSYGTRDATVAAVPRAKLLGIAVQCHKCPTIGFGQTVLPSDPLDYLLTHVPMKA
jgi:hypothetical protein